MSRFIRVTVVLLGLLLSGSLLLPGIAFAHEHREVGNYVFVVGFLNEPAFEGEQNGVSVTITKKDSGEPVAGLAETLKAEVVMGAEQREMALHQAWGDTWGEKGHYTANFYPTAAGDYTFRFFGEIEGTPVDEKFTSSPDTFGSVEAPAEFQFPNTVPATAQLSTELAAARSAARTATILGGAGLATAIVSLAAALIALRRRPATGGVREPSVAGTSRS
jgi:hypothetical protein